MRIRICLLLTCLLLGRLALLGQPHATLHVSQEEAALGEVIDLTLELRHASDVKVYFPSRRQDFLPFEFVRSAAPRTRNRGDDVVETVVYQVRTFDLAKEQQIRLPYRYQGRGDTNIAFVESPTIRLQERIPELNDSLRYRLSPYVNELGTDQEDQSIWVWILGGMLLLGGLMWILRRPVQRWLSRRALRREWMQMRRQVLRLEEVADQRQLFDSLSRLWKHWMDPDDKFGLPSMTTTELEQRLPKLSHLSPGERAILLQASRDADRTIYAGQELSRGVINQLLQSLVEVMQTEYQRRVKQMRNNKQAA